MNYKLDYNEKMIEKESEDYKKVSNQKKKKIENILEKSSKKRVITLRLNDRDLNQIRSIAVSEGIPYQTLISSILHKYINNRLVDKNEVLKISELIK
jgi:predicted DNA binding CopG/RHH family protein